MSKKRKNIIIFSANLLLVFFCIASCFLIIKNEAKAGDLVTGNMMRDTNSQFEQFGQAGPYSAMQIMVGDAKNIAANLKNGATSYAQRFAEAVVKLDEKIDNAYGAFMYKSALKHFLNSLAYDLAENIATGGEGQKPIFHIKYWPEYLEGLVNEAGGAFVNDVANQIGKNEGWKTNFNLCDPDFNVKVRIALGLSQHVRPTAPSCTFKEMRDNWREAVHDDNFIAKFQDMFDVRSNDLGIALSMQTNMFETINKKVEAGTEARREGRGWLSIGNLANIKSPATTGEQASDMALRESTAAEKTSSGHYLADAIDIFVNTLAGKLIDKWLGKGMVEPTISSDEIHVFDAGPNNTGIAGAKAAYRQLTETDFSPGGSGDFDILMELTKCRDPQNAGTNNCVVNRNFTQAVSKKLTLAKAIEEGLINPGGTFGFESGGNEPNYLTGYPYRSMLILRKYRIIPVGWELAAQAIGEDMQKSFTLGDMMACFDEDDAYDSFYENWCSGLVDPNWVLKAPVHTCLREGYGSEILRSSSNSQGRLAVQRKDGYCGDERSCFKEDSDGNCDNAYGYCVEEKRTWNFDTDSCNENYNTCETFSNTDGGQRVAYLKNTLDYSDCSSDVAGCKNYKTPVEYDVDSNDFSYDGESDIYLDRDAQKCSDGSEGCTKLIRTENENEEVFLRLIPTYLREQCYEEEGGQTVGLPEAPRICEDFAWTCSDDDKGCALYTSQTDNWTIPASVVSECPASCVGYKTYYEQLIQHDEDYTEGATIIDQSNAVNIIPKTAQRCSADQVGCREFTNLEKEEAGGESREYYSYLRNCVKPQVGCGEYFTWTGNDETGYQLKVFQLKIDSFGNAVCTPGDDNPTCWTFINSANNNTTYLDYTKLTICSEDCTALRQTDGGATRMAYLPESRRCNASNVGCREYVGPAGFNMRDIFFHQFERGVETWGGVTHSSEASVAGGHSVKLDAEASTTLPSLNPTSRYNLSFIAKTTTAGSIDDIKFINSNDTGYNFTSNDTGLTSNWDYYQYSVSSMSEDVELTDLVITTTGEVFIDDIKLTERIDTYYLIEDSWAIPEECNQDYDGAATDGFMLNCDQYQSSKGGVAYVKSFDTLCDKNVVGCEAMEYHTDNLDLANSLNLTAQNLSGTEYVVYNSNKRCNEKDLGCLRYGLSVDGDGAGDPIFNDYFFALTTDNFSVSTCAEENEDCREWKYGSSGSRQLAYFKDPGENVCKWQKSQGTGSSGGEGWYNLAGNPCGTDKYDMPKTFGVGGRANGVVTPKTLTVGGSKPAAGICDANNSGCVEYIDPYSEFNRSVVFNADFSQDVDGNSEPDGWSEGDDYYQNVELELNTLYILGVKAGQVEVSDLEAAGDNYVDYYELKPVNTLETSADSISTNNHVLFYVKNNNVANSSDKNQAQVSFTGNPVDNEVYLRRAAVNYRLQDEVDDTFCNGRANLSEGCVLFNARERNRGFAESKYDSWTTYAGTEGSLMDLPTKDSNILLKVSPDRACKEWLACRSYIMENKEPVCFDIGLCDTMDSENNSLCANFILSEKEPLRYDNISGANNIDIANLSGYTLVGLANNELSEASYLPSAMEQQGGIADVPNGSFELSGSDGWPIGWNPIDYNQVSMDWDQNKFSVMNSIEIQNEACYQRQGSGGCLIGAPDGEKVLAVYPGSAAAESEFIEVEPDTEYVLNTAMHTLNFIAAKIAGGEDVNGVAAYVQLVTFDDQGSLAQNGLDFEYCEGISNVAARGCELLQDAGREWSRQNVKFKTGSDAKQLKIRIGGRFWYDGGSWHTIAGAKSGNMSKAVTQDDFTGRFYVDNIKIAPALKASDNCEGDHCPDSEIDKCVKDDEFYCDDENGDPEQYVNINGRVENFDYKLVSQSCRIYPESDSLSCDYYDDEYKRQKGMPGYCLQHDRAPGNPEACLLWHPLDKVVGTGIEEGVGYKDRFPLYYATEIEDKISGRFAVAADDGYDLLVNGRYIEYNDNGVDRVSCCYDGGAFVLTTYVNDANTQVIPRFVTQHSGYIPEQPLQPVFCSGGSSCRKEVRTYQADNLNKGENVIAIRAANNNGKFYFALKAAPGEYGYFNDINTNTMSNWKCMGIPESELSDHENGLIATDDDNDIYENLNEMPENRGGKHWFEVGYDDHDWLSPVISQKNGDSLIPEGTQPIWDSEDQKGKAVVFCRYEFIAHPQATQLVQVVTPSGQNKYWAGRMVQGSSFEVPCNDGFEVPGKTCVYSGGEGTSNSYVYDYPPFGAVVPPGENLSDLANPFQWDSKEKQEGKQPLYYEYPNENGYVEPVYQARMGQLHEVDWITRLFAKSYGIWEWQKKCTGGKNNPRSLNSIPCVSPSDCVCPPGVLNCESADCLGAYYPDNSSNLLWDASTSGECSFNAPDTSRMDILKNPLLYLPNSDFCHIKPRVTYVCADGKCCDSSCSQTTEKHTSGIVNFTFNSQLDNQQLPLVGYEINWGDDSSTVVTGVEMNHRPDLNNPHSLYHMYSYWDMLEKSPNSSISCGNGVCTATIKVKVSDNWGFESDWSTGPKVKVHEK